MTKATPHNLRPSETASDRERLEQGRRRLEELLRKASAKPTPQNKSKPGNQAEQLHSGHRPEQVKSNPAPRQQPPPSAAKTTVQPQSKVAARAVTVSTETVGKPAASNASQSDAKGERPRLSTAGEIENAIFASKRAFVSLGIFSFVINILMLAGPLFMLQVYDRVISSGSVPTLVALTIMTTGAYAVIGLLEVVRSRVIVRVGRQIDGRLGNRIFDAAIKTSAAGSGRSDGALRDLDQLRQFVGSPGPLAFFDAPWTPVYLLVIFMAHWVLGIAATIGAAVLFALAWLSETHARAPLQESGKTSARALDIAESGQRNAETITAMGMGPDYRALWAKTNSNALDWQLIAADRLGTMNALSRTLRLLMQSLMLAIGAWLAISGEITAGAIVASTIIFGRALAPVEQAIGQWRPFIKAIENFGRLNELLERTPPECRRTSLPKPQGHLQVKGLRLAAPETRQLILADVSFQVSPGEVLAVVGPSASGKSTLVRALTGLWPPSAGSITLDGARLDQWNPDDLGLNIGYLPQSVELFSGTVRQNIARFAHNAQDDEVVAAAKAAFAHDLILALPNGYDTELGSFGTYLSGGQRQRIALARALFRNPPLIILDEPNANLDRTGDVALSAAIDAMRARGQAVILVSHRVQAIGKADLLLLMDKGQQRAFGPREAVLNMIRRQTPTQAAQRPATATQQTRPQPDDSHTPEATQP